MAEKKKKYVSIKKLIAVGVFMAIIIIIVFLLPTICKATDKSEFGVFEKNDISFSYSADTEIEYYERSGISDKITTKTAYMKLVITFTKVYVEEKDNNKTLKTELFGIMYNGDDVQKMFDGIKYIIENHPEFALLQNYGNFVYMYSNDRLYVINNTSNPTLVNKILAKGDYQQLGEFVSDK